MNVRQWDQAKREPKWFGGGVRGKTTQRRLAQQLFNYQVELCSTWLQWTMSTGVVGNQRTGEHAYNGQT